MTSSFTGIHLACIMDGNGRWAERRGRPRALGHRAGVEALRRVVEAAPAHGVGTLTVYAFSADNWRRPSAEVGALMALLAQGLRTEAPRLKRAGVRLSLIGRRDRLPGALAAAAVRAEWETRRGDRLHLRVAVDYSARDTIRRAARVCTDADARSDDAFSVHLAGATGGPAAPPVDLLLRTGGEQRLSDFLLWECAYAELLFVDDLWPDVTGETVAGAIAAFRGRERRFGGLPARAA